MSATSGATTVSAAASAPAPAPRPALIVMVGAPGSGKSHLAQILAASVGAGLIQTDAVRKEMFPNPRFAPGEAKAVYAACHRRIRERLGRGERVLFDATNLRERRREVLYAIAERAGAVLVVVAAYAPEPVIRARLAQRQHARTPGDVSDADWRVYLLLRKDADPIRRPHIVANTVAAPGPIVRLVARQVGAEALAPAGEPAAPAGHTSPSPHAGEGVGG